MYIGVYGNPIDGLTFTGPFADEDTAIEHMENGYSEDVWWIAELNEPTMQENTKKIADHVDGYDRDDLGESPDH